MLEAVKISSMLQDLAKELFLEDKLLLRVVDCRHCQSCTLQPAASGRPGTE